LFLIGSNVFQYFCGSDDFLSNCTHTALPPPVSPIYTFEIKIKKISIYLRKKLTKIKNHELTAEAKDGMLQLYKIKQQQSMGNGSYK